MKKKWLYSLFLLVLFAGAALADASNPQIHSSAVTQKTDLSIAYLSSVFGTVSGVLTGTSGQMLGKLMYQFNQGILILAGCWLGFTCLEVGYKAATTGSFMQQNNNVPQILIRLAIGFGMLIPSPSTGYTLLQGIVMQVTVQGVKLADQIWEYGLDYMSQGGALWSRPVEQLKAVADVNQAGPSFMSTKDMTAILGDKDGDKDKVVAMPGSFSDLSMIQKIMILEACTVQSSINYDNNHPSSDDVSIHPSYAIQEDLDNFKFVFPGGTSGDNNLCGEVNWNNLTGGTDLGCNSHFSDDNTQCGFSHMALKEIVFDLMPAVKKYVCSANATTLKDDSLTCNGINSTDLGADMTDAMMGALLNYKNLIDPLVRMGRAGWHQDVGLDPMAFATQAKKDGWMTAGRYYWDLLRVEGMYDNAMSFSTSPYRNYIPNTYVQPSNYDSSVLTTLNNLLVDTYGNGHYIDYVNQSLGNFASASTAGSAALSMGTTASAAAKDGAGVIMSVLLGPVVAPIVAILTAFSTNTGPLGLGPEPILWMHNIGVMCMDVSGDIWIGMAIALFPAMLATSVCASVSPLPQAEKAVIDWLQPVLLGAGAAFFVIGVSLGYYMPLYPYMLFTFGVIGWLIAVIEAMVAAPLVALGITHPDGHDFLGRSVQAVMLLVGLFLRPALMLIGLFAAMILCQVSLSIIIYTFSGFETDIFYVGAPNSGGPAFDPVLGGASQVVVHLAMSGRPWVSIASLLMPLLVFPMFLAIFTMLVYTATTTCFSLIHHLPDYVMQWIGAPQPHGVNLPSMADQMKQSIAGGASKLSDSGTHSKYGQEYQAGDFKMNKKPQGGKGQGQGQKPTQ